MSNDEVQEWFAVTHSTAGTRCQVTRQEGRLVIRWAVKAYPSTVREGIREARKGAAKAMADLREGIADVD